jgi:hypothetical protein
LKNVGLYTTHFSISDETGDILNARIDPYHEIEITKQLSITFQSRQFMELNEFSFGLNYKDGYGNFMKQKIEYRNSDISIEPNNYLEG